MRISKTLLLGGAFALLAATVVSCGLAAHSGAATSSAALTSIHFLSGASPGPGRASRQIDASVSPPFITAGQPFEIGGTTLLSGDVSAYIGPANAPGVPKYDPTSGILLASTRVASGSFILSIPGKRTYSGSQGTITLMPGTPYSLAVVVADEVEYMSISVQ